MTFDLKSEGPVIAKALDYFQYKLKGISFMPKLGDTGKIYAQMPYEAITKEKYEDLIKQIEKKSESMEKTEHVVDKESDPKAENFCDGDKCLANFGSSHS